MKTKKVLSVSNPKIDERFYERLRPAIEYAMITALETGQQSLVLLKVVDIETGQEGVYGNQWLAALDDVEESIRVVTVHNNLRSKFDELGLIK